MRTTITQQIEQILDRRLGRGLYKGHGHIDIVRARKKDLQSVLEILENYSVLRENILFQIANKKGEYYAMSMENPEIPDAIRAASANESISEIKKALEELDLLEHRFGRDSINISVIGRARQGKSRLLQSISGLADEVIPASNGGDCTGAKSVICNKPGQKKACADVIFYTEFELLEQVQRYLKELNIPASIGSVAQIPSLSSYIEEFKTNLSSKTGREQSLFGHLRKYIEHFSDYAALLGKEIQTDEGHIRDYVAQYDMQMRPTYRFLGVKEVRIYKEFNYADAGKIVLVDTIGLGDTSLGIREKMLATLRNDSDAAILVRLPSANGDSIRVEDDELYDFICTAMGMTMLSKWLFFALNIGQGLQNFNSGEAMEKALKDRQLNFADIKKADCSDSNDVQDKLLLPILQYLVSNLAIVDEGLLADANKLLESAYMKYYQLCSKATTVLNGGLKAALNSGGLFDELFDDKLGLKSKLNALNQKYKDSDRDSEEIRTEVLRIVRSLGRKCPTIDDIKIKLSEGGPESHVDTAYNFYADNLRAEMRDALDQVNNTVITRLQDGVKAEIVEVLRQDEGGRLGRIMLMGETPATPIEWLNALIEQKTKDFPLVHEALKDIIDYRLNIEGLLEYKANLALEHLDQESPKFTRLPAAVFGLPTAEKADVLLQTLMSAIPDVAQELMDGIRELLRIPVNSFNARIRKLRERIIFKKDGYRELKNFYREYAPVIWSDEFGNISKKQIALKGWNEQLKILGDHNRKNLFVISLEN